MRIDSYGQRSRRVIRELWAARRHFQNIGERLQVRLAATCIRDRIAECRQDLAAARRY